MNEFERLVVGTARGQGRSEVALRSSAARSYLREALDLRMENWRIDLNVAGPIEYADIGHATRFAARFFNLDMSENGEVTSQRVLFIIRVSEVGGDYVYEIAIGQADGRASQPFNYFCFTPDVDENRAKLGRLIAGMFPLAQEAS